MQANELGSPTPLQRQLNADTSDRSPTPLDVFNEGRRELLAGRRIDMGVLASKCGVNRVTLYRWVGTREQLLVEILWSLAEQKIQLERDRVRSNATPHTTEVILSWLRATLATPGIQRFLQEENDFAMRLLTLASGGFQPRLLRLFREMLADDVANGRIANPVPLDDLAFTVLRICESYFYLPTITGEATDPDRLERVLSVFLKNS